MTTILGDVPGADCTGDYTVDAAAVQMVAWCSAANAIEVFLAPPEDPAGQALGRC